MAIADPDTSSISCSPTTVSANGESVTVITVVARDSDSQPVPGQRLFCHSSNDQGLSWAWVDNDTQTTDDDGTAVFNGRSGVVEAVEFYADIEDDSGEDVIVVGTIGPSDTVTFTEQAVGGGASISVTPASVPADGESKAVITVVVLDDDDVPMGGAYVEITKNSATCLIAPDSLQLTDSYGTASWDATNTVEETVTFGARVNGVDLP